MDNNNFFVNDGIRSSLARFTRVLDVFRRNTKSAYEWDAFIRNSIDLFNRYPDEFDASCSFNIEHIGSTFAGEIGATNLDEQGYQDVFISCYRFLSEFNFYNEERAPDSVGYEVAKALGNIRFQASELPTKVKRQLVYADNFMPVALAKSYLNRVDFQLMRDFDTRHAGLGEVLIDLDTRLRESRKEVRDLHDALKNYKDAFNFVGLHKGFDDMAKSKVRSARFSMSIMVMLFALIIAPFCWKIWHLMSSEISTGFNFELIIAFIGYDLLLLYFFRIVFHGYKSVKGQLVQLDLRKAVCQFIQSYADYAAKIKGDNPALLEKFEALVFSGIVANEDNIPSTFDGLEQMMKLYEKVKG